MSSPFTYSLNAAAAYVLRSLIEHPDWDTAEAIAGRELDGDAAQAGLDELKGHGLAERDADGRWRATDAGRAAHEAR